MSYQLSKAIYNLQSLMTVVILTFLDRPVLQEYPGDYAIVTMASNRFKRSLPYHFPSML